MSGGRRQSGEADPRNVGRIRLQEVLRAPAPAASRTPPGKAAARSVPGASPQGLGDADLPWWPDRFNSSLSLCGAAFDVKFKPLGWREI